MKVYLSSWFASKERMKLYRQELEQRGIEVTSRWLDERVKSSIQANELEDSYLRETAMLDLEDMHKSDTFVLFVPDAPTLSTIGARSWSRGGRNFEAGYFYALMTQNEYPTSNLLTFVLVGERESVFHFLDGEDVAHVYPTINQFPTWEAAREFLEQAASAKTQSAVRSVSE